MQSQESALLVACDFAATEYRERLLALVKERTLMVGSVEYCPGGGNYEQCEPELA
jgi:hypothetical protein